MQHLATGVEDDADHEAASGADEEFGNDDRAGLPNMRRPDETAIDYIALKQVLRAGLPLTADESGRWVATTRPGSAFTGTRRGDEDQDDDTSETAKRGDTAAPPRRRVMAASGGHHDHMATELVRVDTPMIPQIDRVKSGDLEDMGRWYFHTQLPAQDTNFFQSAQDHWAYGVWDMARINKPMFDAMAAFALHKKVALSEPKSQALYLEKKVNLIQSIQSELGLAVKTTDSLTIVAIAMLAFFDIRDLQFKAAEHHLRAVSKFVNMVRIFTKDSPAMVMSRTFRSLAQYAIMAIPAQLKDLGRYDSMSTGSETCSRHTDANATL